jgi:Asp-tRNA(Asn)/Glu-tRNA(Gln) amidotransferase A subunit family amidase
VGALHGVPVGLKDIVDTAGMPTQRGTPIFRQAARFGRSDRRTAAGRRCCHHGQDRDHGTGLPQPQPYPQSAQPDRTPGGSSSGSAAAVAAHHVPLAVGTQTNGSVIRPASFCGVYGFKPTRGVISRRGILQTSVSLDQVGVFARSLGDVALLSDAMGGYDQTDPASFARPRPAMARGAAETAPVEPDFAFFDMPFHDRLASDTREGLDAVMETLGKQVVRLQPADTMAGLVAVQATIHEYEICMHLADTFDAHWSQVSPLLQGVVERGRQISKAQYEDALAVKASAEKFFADFFVEFDAIIAPSAAGEAPLSEHGTGDPVFCTLWTLAGLPSITLPLLVGDNDLPIGVQLIGPAEKDDRLLRTAGWLQTRLAEETA